MSEPWQRECPRVSVNRAEVEQGAFRGIMRRSRAMFSNYTARNGAPSDMGWQYDIEGAIGEIAFCKYRNVYWPADMDFSDDDGGGVGIRTRSRMDYELRLFQKDSPARAYVLMLGLAPHYWVRGWIWGHEGKQQKYWGNPTGNDRASAFWVPQSALRSIYTLPPDVVPLFKPFPVEAA